MWTWKDILTALAVLLILIGAFVLIFRLTYDTSRHNCSTLNERIAPRETKWEDGSCWVEIAPEHFVRQSEIVYQLDAVEPVE